MVTPSPPQQQQQPREGVQASTPARGKSDQANRKARPSVGTRPSRDGQPGRVGTEKPQRPTSTATTATARSSSAAASTAATSSSATSAPAAGAKSNASSSPSRIPIRAAPPSSLSIPAPRRRGGGGGGGGRGGGEGGGGSTSSRGRGTTSLRTAFKASTPGSSPAVARGRTDRPSSVLSRTPSGASARTPDKTRGRPAAPRTKSLNTMGGSAINSRRPQSSLLRANTTVAREPSSSPPRGLREAYERIVDEENLTSAESPSEPHVVGGGGGGSGSGNVSGDDVHSKADQHAGRYSSHEVNGVDDAQGPVNDWLKSRGLAGGGTQSNEHAPVEAGRQSRAEQIARSTSPLPIQPPQMRSPRSRLHAYSSRTGRPASDYGDLLDDLSIETGSNFSGLSSLDNGTDDSFLQTLAKHRQARQRVVGALSRDRPVFSRASQPAHRASLTQQNLLSRDTSDGVVTAASSTGKEVPTDAGSAHSGTSDVSDLPVRLPKGWGRKARHGHDWLSRNQERRSSVDSDKAGSRLRMASTSGAVDGAGGERRHGSLSLPDESRIDWIAAAADTPLPSVEDDFAAERAAHNGGGGGGGGGGAAAPIPRASGTLSRRQYRSLERLLQPDAYEDQFAPRSLPTSTSPLTKARFGAVDRLREREIEALKGKAVTTNRLDQIKERTSREQLRPRVSEAPDASQREHEAPAHQGEAAGSVAPPGDSQHSGNARARPAESGLDELLHAGTEGTGRENGQPNEKELPTAEDRSVENNSAPMQPGRPSTETRDLLVQLARATSNSSNRMPEASEASLPGATLRTSPSVEGPAGTSKPSEHHASNSGQVDDNTDGDADSNTRHDDNSTPRAGTEASQGKTPAMIIGGWIDTPASTDHVLHRHGKSAADADGQSPSLGIHDFIRGPNTSPLYRRGADIKERTGKSVEGQHQQAVNGVSQTEKSLQLSTRRNQAEGEGDNTLDSLDRLLADETLDFSPPIIPANSKASGAPDNGSKDVPHGDGAHSTNDAGQLAVATLAERERRPEELAYERVDERLQALLLNVRGAKHDINEVQLQQLQLSHAQIKGNSSADAARGGLAVISTSAGRRFWACPQCGNVVALCDGRHSGSRLWCSRVIARIPFPSLYKRHGRRIRLTWLGLVWTAIWGYLLAEFIACKLFCAKHSWEGDAHGMYTPFPPFALFGLFRWYFPQPADALGAFMCRHVGLVAALFPERCEWLVWPDLPPAGKGHYSASCIPKGTTSLVPVTFTLAAAATAAATATSAVAAAAAAAPAASTATAMTSAATGIAAGYRMVDDEPVVRGF